jgi:hypothetical protein
MLGSCTWPSQRKPRQWGRDGNKPAALVKVARRQREPQSPRVRHSAEFAALAWFSAPAMSDFLNSTPVGGQVDLATVAVKQTRSNR